jgi:hypothetical protein
VKGDEKKMIRIAQIDVILSSSVQFEIMQPGKKKNH